MLNRFLPSSLFILLMVATQATPVLAFQYTSNSDTLFLKAEKCKGFGLFGNFAWYQSLQDIHEVEDLNAILPSDLEEVKFAEEFVDMNLLAYNNVLRDEAGDVDQFLANHYPSKIDTAQLPSRLDNSIRIIVGKQGKNQILIVDQNNNNDFRDDPVRRIKSTEDAPPADPIPVQFKMYNGEEVLPDTGWVSVYMSKGRLVYGVAEYFKSRFTLDDQVFEIQFRSGLPNPRFTLDFPILALTTENGVSKDSLRRSERLEKKEYVRLGDTYYQLAQVAHDGHSLTLIKEKDVSDKIGTQVGFIAPNFSGISTDGDSITLKDYKNKYLLLVNITACWSAKMSYEYYKELTDHYNSKLEVVAIDETLGALQANIRKLKIPGPFLISKGNRFLKHTYREDYCSRTCFLIGPAGHIVDKFEIADWEDTLAQYFE